MPESILAESCNHPATKFVDSRYGIAARRALPPGGPETEQLRRRWSGRTSREQTSHFARGSRSLPFWPARVCVPIR